MRYAENYKLNKKKGVQVGLPEIGITMYLDFNNIYHNKESIAETETIKQTQVDN